MSPCARGPGLEGAGCRLRPVAGTGVEALQKVRNFRTSGRLALMDLFASVGNVASQRHVLDFH